MSDPTGLLRTEAASSGRCLPLTERQPIISIGRMMADVVPLELTSAHALRMVREIAADTNRIVVLAHAAKRARQRRVSRRQIELCCQKGSITEGPFMNQYGQWQVNLFRHAAGEELTCAVAIDWPSRLLVITTF